MRPATVLKLAAIAAVLLVVALVQVVKSIDVDRYRDLLSQAVSAATGRRVAFSGPLSLRLSFSPALIADGVTFANAAWGSRPDMVRIDHLQADIGLLPLFTGEVKVSGLLIDGVDILLETDGKGQANWDFDHIAGGKAAAIGAPAAALRIGRVGIDNARLRLRQDGAEEVVQIDHLTAEADAFSAPIAVTTAGSWSDRRFDVSAVLGSLKDGLAGDKPFPLKVKAVLPGLVATANGAIRRDKAAGLTLSLAVAADAADIAEAARLAGWVVPPLGAARASVVLSGSVKAPSLSAIDIAVGRHDSLAFGIKGAVASPLTGQGMDLVLTADGDAPSAAGKAVDQAWPLAGPVSLGAHVTTVDGGWRIADLKGSIGHSDIAGQAMVRVAGGRPSVDAHLESQVIDWAEWNGRHADPIRPSSGESRVFSAEAIPFHLLSDFDGRLSWTVDRLADRGLSARRVAVAAELRDGKLRATPTVGALAGGKLDSAVTVDVSGRMPLIGMTLAVDKVSLGDLLDQLGVTSAVQGGRTDLRLNLTGSGDSVRAVMAHLAGEGLLSIGPASIDGVNADGLADDVLRQLSPWGRGDTTEMRCLVGRFSVSDGTVRSEVLLADTATMTVGGQGSINLANEGLDITLTPRPKEVGLLSLAVPLDVGGTLAHPSAVSNKGAIVKGVAASVALGPLAALAPAVGGGCEPYPCFQSLAQGAKAAPARSVGGAPR